MKDNSYSADEQFADNVYMLVFAIPISKSSVMFSAPLASVNVISSLITFGAEPVRFAVIVSL